MVKSVKWSDAMLRTAVASERSWRGVARELGCLPTSAGSLRAIRRRVNRLGLDTSHFTGQRRWSDTRLREAVAESSSWSEVLMRLDTAGSADCRSSAKGHAARLGLDVSHLEAPARKPAPSAVTNLPARPDRLRHVAEDLATAWFLLHGRAVSVPRQAQPYDLVVEFPDGFRRVQVKSSVRAGEAGWQVGLTHRPARLDDRAGHECYDPDSIDYFFVVDGNGGLYLIPSDRVAGRTRIVTRAYRDYLVGDAGSILGRHTMAGETDGT